MHVERVSDADRYREYVRKQYLEPARAHGDTTVRVRVGDVHKALALKNRVPGVCQALESRKFLEQNHLTIEKKEGPPGGQSTNVTFTYRLKENGQPSHPPNDDLFLSLRGIGKETFASLGGGEAFIRREREHFYDGYDEDE